MLAYVFKSLAEKNPDLDLAAIDDIIAGCANQAGEDNRNVERMTSLLAGYPASVTGTTVNRLCGSSMDAINLAYAKVKSFEADLILAAGVESMSRAPFVMPKPEIAFSQTNEVHDTTIGWRFINPLMKQNYGVNSMPKTAENVAKDYKISGEDQDLFAFNSQKKTAKAIASGRLAEEIISVKIKDRKGNITEFSIDEHPRLSSLETLASLKTPFKEGGSVTAGNAFGVNNGAGAVFVASYEMIKKYNLNPIAKIIGGATAGVTPRVMGIAPLPATEKLCKRLKIPIEKFSVIELNEAFASQALAVIRGLGLKDSDSRINPNGGAIALGHPLGMSGLRITATVALELSKVDGQFALATMCIGVGQGIAIALQKL